MKDIVDQAVERGLKVVLILPINPKAKPPESENIIVVDTGMILGFKSGADFLARDF